MVAAAPYANVIDASFRAISREARREQTRGYATLGVTRLLLAALITLTCVLQLNAAARDFIVAPWSEENALLLASSFMATSVDGSTPPATRDLNAYKGNVTLVYYWSFDCMACSNVLRDLETVNARMAAEGLRVVALNVDDSTFTDALRNEITYRGYTIDMLKDSPGHGKLVKRAGVLPWVLLYDRSGIPRNVTHTLMPDRVYSYWLLPVAAREIRDLLAAPEASQPKSSARDSDATQH